MYLRHWFFDAPRSVRQWVHDRLAAKGALETDIHYGDAHESSMRATVVDGEPLLLLSLPDEMFSINQGATPALRLYAWASSVGDYELMQLLTDDGVPTLERRTLGVKGIPDVTRHIEYFGRRYYRLALPWWHPQLASLGLPEDPEPIIFAVEDTPEVQAAVPVAQALARLREVRVLALGEGERAAPDPTSLGEALWGFGTADLLRRHLERLIGSSAHHATLTLHPMRASDTLPLDSGTVVPLSLVADDDQRLNLLATNWPSIEGVCLKHGVMLATGQSAHLLWLHDQGLPSLTDEQITELLETFNTQRLRYLTAGEQERVARLRLPTHVRNLLELPRQRALARLPEEQAELRQAMRQVSELSRRLHETRNVLRAFEQDTNAERVQSVTDSLLRAGKIKTLRVEDGLIHATTSTIYVQDDRSGAWHEIGDFAFTIDTESLTVRFKNLTRTLDELAYGTHPHIEVGGTPCFGNFDLVLSQLAETQDWLGVVEMCVGFLESANTDDVAGQNLHRWPFVDDPESVGLPPYSGQVQPFGEPRDDRIINDQLFEDGHTDSPRTFEEILERPANGDTLWLYSDHLDDYRAFTYDDDAGDWFHAGYNRDGYDHDGYDEEGYDREGLDDEGYDRDGYDDEGYDREGRNQEGRTREEEAAHLAAIAAELTPTPDPENPPSPEEATA